ncbi:MAG: hypothetical protein JSU03_05305 [Bacteroidetes bacterium]|nr:hypothetical protein [Bacteroidota bacterium]MBS1756675.1 hypothetical protein [Bacteroidota bacterium]
MIITNIKKIITTGALATMLLAMGCKKNSYFDNTGLTDPRFQGTVLDYLKSKPVYFDSIVKIIHIAGLDDAFTKEDITFFAPADSSVRRTLMALNQELRLEGKNEVTRLEQIKPAVWRAQLTRYLFKGKKSLNDYPQLDGQNISAYPGQIYAAYDGQIMNIGVVYNDAGGVKYAGYRQLFLSYIPSPTSPRDYNTWFSVPVASVNIQPTNGYVHALVYVNHYFGFEPNQFIENAIAAGID